MNLLASFIYLKITKLKWEIDRKAFNFIIIELPSSLYFWVMIFWPSRYGRYEMFNVIQCLLQAMNTNLHSLGPLLMVATCKYMFVASTWQF